MAKTSAAQIRASTKYNNAHYKPNPSFPKNTKDRIVRLNLGITPSEFIKIAVEEKLRALESKTE